MSSKSDARRLVQQGGVRVDGQTVSSNEYQVTAVDGREVVIQAGKRKFLRVIPAERTKKLFAITFPPIAAEPQRDSNSFYNKIAQSDAL